MRTEYMKGVDKSEKIKEWVGKGAEWCAEQLWIARRQRHENLEKYNEEHEQNTGAEAELAKLRLINGNMADVMEEHGIQPERLVVTYTTSKCIAGEDNERCYVAGGCEHCVYNERHTRAKTIPFYSIDITDETLKGITRNFENIELTVLKIVDFKTKKVIYECEKGEE